MATNSHKEPVSVSKYVPEPVKGTKIYGVARANKPEIKRFAKFALTGLSGLFVDYLLLNILAHVFHVAEPIAVGVAFVVAATNNYIWNRLWVYPESRSVKKRKQMPVFLAVNAVGLVINEIVLFLFYIPISLALGSEVLGLNVTKGIAAVIVMIWNYVVNRVVTFRNVKWVRNLPDEVKAEPEIIDSAL
jgi:dolichol-phosphate mannosyltransferase